MSDFKSKLPDFKELSSMTGKLFRGIKSSVEEIIKDYKEKRAESDAKEEVVVKTTTTKSTPTETEETVVEAKIKTTETPKKAEKSTENEPKENK